MKKLFNLILTLIITIICIAVFGLFYERYKLKEFTSVIESDPYYIVDSTAGHLHSPNYSIKYQWKEHPSGYINKSANNLGFVETDSTIINKPDSTFRVLITGDSHIDGVVSTNESFPNLLETRLNTKFKDKKIEVINGGVGFYSFKNYEGFLKKYQYLKPDLFIVTVYTGNDFIEGILYDTENRDYIPVLETFWYRLVKGFFQFKTGMASTQASNQLLFFKTFPEKKEQALNIAEKHLTEIQKLCVLNNTKLLVVFLPTKVEAEKEFRENLKNKSGWTDEDLNINKTLADNLGAWLNKQNIDQINATENLSNLDKKLFWDADQHLNINGHSALTKTVFEKYRWRIFDRKE